MSALPGSLGRSDHGVGDRSDCIFGALSDDFSQRAKLSIDAAIVNRIADPDDLSAEDLRVDLHNDADLFL